jgi:hypothetical protein
MSDIARKYTSIFSADITKLLAENDESLFSVLQGLEQPPISRLPGPQQVLMVLMVLIRINTMAINTPGWKFYALMVLMDLSL